MAGKYKKVKLSSTGTVHASRVVAQPRAADSDDDSDNFQVAAAKPRQGKANVLDDDSDDADAHTAPVSTQRASTSKRSARKTARNVDDEVIITSSHHETTQWLHIWPIRPFMAGRLL